MGEEALEKKCLRADKKKKNAKVNAEVMELEEEVLIEDEGEEIGDDEDDNGRDVEGENLYDGLMAPLKMLLLRRTLKRKNLTRKKARKCPSVTISKEVVAAMACQEKRV